MPLFAPAHTESTYEPVPAGNHVARCIGLIHIGTIPVTFQGDTKYMNKVRLTFELPTELKEFKEGEGERPYSISGEYTLSLHENATLRALLESWRGKKFTEDELATFDIEKLVGKPCMVNVVHTEKNGKTYANIAGISPVPKGMQVPDQINPSKVLLYDKWDQDVFDSLPDFLKEKIKSSDQYQNMMGQQTDLPAHPARDVDGEEVNIDDIPF